MKKIWIVSAFDNLPMEGYRAQRFWLMARAFQRAGWAVTYWTSGFSHANKRVRKVGSREYEVGSGGELVEGVYEGIRLRILEAPGYMRNVSVRRFWSHWVLARRFAEACRPSYAASPTTEGRPDLLVVASPTLGLVRAVREMECRYIVDVMDAWPETFERVVPRWMLGALGLYRMARRNYLRAAGISVVARRYEELVRGYGYRGEVREFLHGIAQGGQGSSRSSSSWNLGEYAVSTRSDSMPRTLATTLRLVYAGNMSLSYDLETLIRAVQETPNVTLDLAGDGPDRARLEREVEKVGGGGQRRIRLLGYLGAEGLEKVLRESDVGVVPMWPASCVGVPYKLADYAQAGLRVIESLGGETGEIVQRFGAGAHYEAGDVASLKAAIGEELKKLGEGEGEEVEKVGGGGQRKDDFDKEGFAGFFDAERIYSEYVKWAEGLT